MEKWIQEGFLKRIKGKSLLNFSLDKHKLEKNR